jgi:hypothetical protein
MSEYEELMQRYGAMKAQWMTFVDGAKAAGWTAKDLWTAGAVLGSKGQLRMTGKNERGSVVLEMEMVAGEDEVRMTYVAPWVEALVA